MRNDDRLLFFAQSNNTPIPAWTHLSAGALSKGRTSVAMTGNSHSLQNSLDTGALPSMTRDSVASRASSTEQRASGIEQQYLLDVESGIVVSRPVQHVTVYECPFPFLGCEEWFYEPEAWRSHAETHFENHSPPNSAICCFCDIVFNHRDPNICWGLRMNHVALHHIRGDRLARCKPDYALIRYMYEIRRNRLPDYYTSRTAGQVPSVYGAGELVYGNQQPVQPTSGVGGQPEYVINADPRRGRRHRGGRSS